MEVGRSGKLFAKNDPLIEELINDPNYQILADGTIKTKICLTGKVSVKEVWREAGYQRQAAQDVFPYWVINYKNRKVQIHRIIYRKFHGPLSPDLVVNHINGNPLDNRAQNLELISQSENLLHRYRVLKRKGVRGNSKITQNQAQELRKDYRSGKSYRELMEKYGLQSKGTIHAILKHDTWPDPSDPDYQKPLEVRHRKITHTIAEQIRQERKLGVTISGLCHKFGLRRSAIKDIVSGRSWKVPAPPNSAETSCG